MLCTDGTCSVLLNQRELHIKKNDLLFFGPNDKIEDVDKTVFDKVKFIPVRNFSEAVAIAVNNTVRITDNQWNGIDMSAVRSASKTANIVKQ